MPCDEHDGGVYRRGKILPSPININHAIYIKTHDITQVLSFQFFSFLSYEDVSVH